MPTRGKASARRARTPSARGTAVTGRGLSRTDATAATTRRVGHYSNLSVFDVADNDRLHELLWQLPLFPYMTVEVVPLALHPSDIALNDSPG